MSSCIGNALRVSIFGQSHSPAIGCSIDGLPAGIPIDLEELQRFLDRRAPGRDETATARKETDVAHIISGIVDGHTCGAPIAGIIVNGDTRSTACGAFRDPVTPTTPHTPDTATTTTSQAGAISRGDSPPPCASPEA